MSDLNSRTDEELIALLAEGPVDNVPWTHLDDFLSENNIDTGPYITYPKYIYVMYLSWCKEPPMLYDDFYAELFKRFEEYYDYVCISNKEVAWQKLDKQKKKEVQEVFRRALKEQSLILQQRRLEKKKKRKTKPLKYINGMLLDLPD